jgi:RNA polymerase sigma-70 factor, ECF subfamily
VDDLTRLAVSARQGDRRALDEFVRRAQLDVWRLCSYLGDRDTADDLAQETFVRAVRGLPRFRAESGARSWLLAIARHTCADHVRRRTRERRLFDRLAGDAGDGTTPGSGTVELTELVEHLPLDRREAFVLTQLLGLSYEEAAEVAGCPVGTIRSRVARARAQMIEQLADQSPASADHRLRRLG